MRIIDFHTHIYPDAIAPKAAANIGKFYDLPMRFDGTLGALFNMGEAAGIDAYVVFSVATSEKQVPSINDYIASQVSAHPGKLYGLAAMHPDYVDFGAELDRIQALGLKGIKLHPDFQRFKIDDARMMPLYAQAERRRLPIVVHTGDSRFDFSGPQYVLNVMQRYPNLKMICAHFGGWSQWEQAVKLLAGSGVMVDTCSSLAFLSTAKAQELIAAYGEDNVLFGTDYPMWDAKDELAMLRALDLGDAVLEKILSLNAMRVLGI